MKNFLKEFKEFINRGNVMDLAIGVVIGTAFQKIVTSLVNDIIFPAIAPAMNVGDFGAWKIDGIMIGNFIKSLVDFLIIAFVIFLVVKVINRFKKKEEAKPTEPPVEVRLLTEIRDILKNK
jgi:large conductance mechanosensitive channel